MVSVYIWVLMKWPYILNKDVRHGSLPIAGITVMYGLLNAALYQRARCITHPLSLPFPPSCLSAVVKPSSRDQRTGIHVP